MLASCRHPGFLAKGRKTGNDHSHGQIVTYECTAKGYSLVGTPQLTCNDGSWDSKRPECKGNSLSLLELYNILHKLSPFSIGNAECMDK